MAVLLFAVTILAISGHSCGNWCVCKDGSDAALQRTLDYACGAGADCNPIHLNGPCFQPNTVKAHCSYAVNSFFQKKAQGQGSCDFAGTATVTTTDPSYTGCAFPSSFSSTGTSTTPVTTTPSTTTPTTPSYTTPSTTPTSTTTPSTTTPTTANPYTTTPSTGVLGGIGTGLGPSGLGTNTDISDGGFVLQRAGFLFVFLWTLGVLGLIC